MVMFGDRLSCQCLGQWLSQRLFPVCCMGVLLLLLVGCQGGQAPREFAPDGTIIAETMRMELRQYYRGLSQTLTAKPPALKLQNIQVTQLDSFFLKGLPVYHVQGTYDLALTFSSHTETRKRNPFDLHLQRQQEGKTWRSLKKVPSGWQSFVIRG